MQLDAFFNAQYNPSASHAQRTKLQSGQLLQLVTGARRLARPSRPELWRQVLAKGARRVTEDGRIKLPNWTTLAFAAHDDTRTQGTRTPWTLGIDNLADRHCWRESPKQFGHYHLYPGAPRSVRLRVKASF